MKEKAELSRRRIIKLGLFIALAPSSVILTGCDGSISEGDLLSKYGKDDDLAFPEVKGLLTDKEKKKYWQFYGFLGKEWEMQTFEVIQEEEFGNFLNLKTSYYPSYFSEYKNGMDILRHINTYGDFKNNFSLLFIKFADQNNIGATSIGHFRNFVISQLLKYHLINGGFKRFNIRNVSGHPGGSYSNPADLPYR
jgi:hypothetical protein